MTGFDLFIGMSYIDEELIDEALRFREPKALKQGLLAACAAAAVFAGVLAVRHLSPSARPPEDAPTQLDERIETPAPTPEADETGDGSLSQFEDSETTPGTLGQGDSPQSRQRGEGVTEDSPRSPRGTASDAPEQEASSTPVIARSEATRQSVPDDAREDGFPRRADALPGMTDPQPTPAPAQPTDRPQPTPAPAQSTDRPQPTPEPQTASTAPPVIGQVEPIPQRSTISAERSFTLLTDGDGDPAVLQIIKKDGDSLVRYDSDYTEVRCVSDGFEILSQERTASGEILTARLLPEHPAGTIATLTLQIMDGESVKKTFVFYGLKTDKGSWTGTSTKLLWVLHYAACRQAGEITSEVYDQIINALQFYLKEPVFEDPRLSLGELPLRIINAQADSMSVNAGESPAFFVEAMGSGLAYQWQYCGAGAAAWTDLPGETGPIMRFTATMDNDGQSFRCVVTDDKGGSITSEPVRLTVNEALAITAQPQDVTVDAGRMASFTITVTGQYLAFRWQYYNADAEAWEDIAGKNTSWLYFTAQPVDNGLYYRCVVTDGASSTVTSDAARLTVRSADAPTDEPSGNASAG